MKIFRIGIHGFGKFGTEQEAVSFSFSDGLNIIFGANESGKSTLQSCITHLLFGSTPPWGLPDYRPWCGAPYRAWMEVEFCHPEDGFPQVYRIERDFARKRLCVLELSEGGKVSREFHDEGSLRELLICSLGTAEERVFYSTFCITQSDFNPYDKKLKRLDERTPPLICEAVEKAVSGSGEATVTAACKALEKKLAELRRSGSVNVGPLTRVQRQLKSLAARRQELEDECKRLQELRRKRSEQSQLLITLEKEMLVRERLLNTERRRRQEKQQLDALTQQLEQTAKQIEQIKQLQETLRQLNDELSNFNSAYRKPELKEQAYRLLEQIPRLEMEEESLCTRRQEAGKALEAVSGELQALLEEIEELKGERNRCEEQLQLWQRRQKAEQELSVLRRRLEEVQELLRRIEEHEEELNELDAALQQFPAALVKEQDFEVKAVQAAQQREEALQGLRLAEREWRQAQERWARTPRLLAPMLILLLGTALTVSAFILHWQVACFFFLIVTAISGLWLRAVSRQRDTAQSEYQRARERWERSQEDWRTAERKMQEFLAPTGANDLYQLAQWAGQVANIAARKREIEAALKSVAALGSKSKEELQREQSDLDEKIAALSSFVCRGSAPLPTPLTPASPSKSSRKSDRGDGDPLAEEPEASQMRLQELEQKLAQKRQRETELAKSQSAWEARLNQVQEELQQLQPQLRAVYEERERLLQETQAEGLETLVQRIRAFEQLTNSSQRAEAGLQAILQGLQGRDVADLEAEQRRLALERLTLQERLQGYQTEPLSAHELAHQELELNRMRSEWEGISRQLADWDIQVRVLSVREEELREVEEQMEEARTQWQRLAVQALSLQKAKQVLLQASQQARADVAEPIRQTVCDLLSHITHGRYNGAVVKINSRAFEFALIESQTERVVEAESLSRGTRDQLHFAVRYALAKALTTAARGDSQAQPFLILDDPFVNYDTHRLIAVLKALREVSRRAQVLLFTHEEQVASLTASFAHILRLE